MFEIVLENAGKRYNRDWIFRSVDYRFCSGKSYAITGNNGSGKSTLLQCIAASMDLKEGRCLYKKSEQPLKPEKYYEQIAIVAPYLELIEEMTAAEFLQFHASFKKLKEDYAVKDILEAVGLKDAAHKQIRYFSSGMKQRIKLAQAIFSDTEVLLLDEPCTNLDSEGYELYQTLIQQHAQHKVVIVSSNDKNEYSFCNEIIDIRNYKAS